MNRVTEPLKCTFIEKADESKIQKRKKVRSIYGDAVEAFLKQDKKFCVIQATNGVSILALRSGLNKAVRKANPEKDMIRVTVKPYGENMVLMSKELIRAGRKS